MVRTVENFWGKISIKFLEKLRTDSKLKNVTLRSMEKSKNLAIE